MLPASVRVTPAGHGASPSSKAAGGRSPIPARAGIGLRAPHHLDLLAGPTPAGWLEAHTENYFADGGAHVACLERLRADYPLSLHGVGLSIGSTDPLNAEHLGRVARAVTRFEPALVSEHLSFSSAGGVFANDLLPLPYTEEALEHVAGRIRAVQDALGRQILIENVSSYLQFECSTLPEWTFLAGVVAESGCGLLLDLNNVYVAAENHGFSPLTYLAALDPASVQEYHLAGHDEVSRDGRRLLIDTHGKPVCAAVWELYAWALEHIGPRPALIEWDTDIPSLAVLLAEAQRADALAADTLAHTPVYAPA